MECSQGKGSEGDERGEQKRVGMESLTAEFWAVEDKPKGIADTHVGGGEARTEDIFLLSLFNDEKCVMAPKVGRRPNKPP